MLLPKDEDFGGVKGYLMWAVLLIAGIACWWWFVADLADEVEDHGDWLLVRRGNIEEKVLLTNIMHVKDAGPGESPRIVLRLVVPGKFGRAVAFMPTLDQDSGWSLNPFANTIVGQGLIDRVAQARQQLRKKPAA